MIALHKPFLSTALACSLGLFSLAASAQTESYSTLKTLQGYEPSIIASESEALSIYRLMPTEIFKDKSQCHQRAHYWAYHLYNQRALNTMKIYLFFTERYKREFDYDWGYHVAPLMAVRQSDGSIQEMVFDPTFTSTPDWDKQNDDQYDNKPVRVDQWIRYFIFPDVQCPVVENYDDYFKFQDRYYCYVMKTPMYNYIPDNLETETRPRTEWREGDLIEMKNGLKNH